MCWTLDDGERHARISLSLSLFLCLSVSPRKRERESEREKISLPIVRLSFFSLFWATREKNSAAKKQRDFCSLVLWLVYFNELADSMFSGRINGVIHQLYQQGKNVKTIDNQRTSVFILFYTFSEVFSLAGSDRWTLVRQYADEQTIRGYFLFVWGDDCHCLSSLVFDKRSTIVFVLDR